MTCTEMAFFPTNFMLQTSHDHDDHQPSTSLNPLLPSCTPQDFHGVASFLGKRSVSYSGVEVGGQNGEGEEELSDDGSQAGEKKRRLNMEQVKTLEKNFELGNKLEPERKMQLARALGLQPRQIAIWFQNRRARWKTKQLEKDFELLKRQFDAVKAENDALQAQNHKLHSEIMALKNRDQQPTESINLNKETEGSCSNRSENSSEIKLDMSRTATTTPAIDSHPHGGGVGGGCRPIFPPSNGGIRPAAAAAATVAASAHHFHNPSRPPPPPPSDFLHHHQHHHHQSVKEESLSSMFCSIDDQTGFWPWLEQQHFN